ncbi:hypothetical protein LMG29542_03264 [Paraburkholderia humisilvae]|uniref:Uncharacterized protein n=1 Tax=Paraburkholderia humisilvae TaxID=627669 RepID=A0A6J5DVE0_9BURK|nr:hypothetical protein LMG29542_03264 [Paraburkholderia humisilvae]
MTFEVCGDSLQRTCEGTRRLTLRVTCTQFSLIRYVLPVVIVPIWAAGSVCCRHGAPVLSGTYLEVAAAEHKRRSRTCARHRSRAFDGPGGARPGTLRNARKPCRPIFQSRGAVGNDRMLRDGPPRMEGRSTWSGRERSSHSRFPPVPRVGLVTFLFPSLCFPRVFSLARLSASRRCCVIFPAYFN